MASVENIRSRYLVFPLAVLLTMASIAYSDEHIIPNSSLIQPYLWTYGCTPTSAAMVLSFYDNYESGIGKHVGYGKLIKYYLNAPCSLHNVPNTLRELKDEMSTDYNVNSCSGDGGTDPWNIDDGIRAVTNDSNGYGFTSENICWAVWPEIFTDWCWDEIKSVINANMPFVWSQGNVSGFNVAGHSVAAWGYRDDKYVIVYQTWTTGREDWYYTDYCGDSDDDIVSMQVNMVAPDGGSDSDILLDEPIGGETLIIGGTGRIHWYQWGSQIASVNIDASTDAGNTWVNVGSVSSPGAGWKSYDWQVPNASSNNSRVRVYAYDSAGELIAADGSFNNFTIKPPCSDLIVQSITTNPVTPVDHQDVDVTVTVKNQGSCPASPYPSFTYNIVEFYKNRDSAPSHSDWGDISDGFGEVPPGGTVTLSGKISYSYADTFKMWAQVDSDQNVTETDENNNVFGPQSITVLPDNEPPTGSIEINGGAEWTNSLSVTLNLTCADYGSGCDKMRFFEDPLGEWTPSEPFATTKPWTLTGYNLPVYVRFYDKSSNWSQYSDIIWVDTEAPTGSIVINDGATRTKTESVTLTLSCTDHMSRPGAMRLSNDNMTWEPWEALPSYDSTITVSRAWTLSGGEGTKSVYVQYRDNADNISEIYSDTIDFLANQPPVANCASVTVAAGPACTAPASIDNGSSDPDGDPLTLDLSPPGPYPLGPTSVTLTVTDDAGAFDTCTATVTVVDDTVPTITPSPVAAECTGGGGTEVTYTPVTATDNCDPAPAVTCSPPSGSLFPLGDTTVTCTATDASGNTSGSSFTVTVEDTTPPTISPTSDIMAECTGPEGTVVTYSLPTATDICDSVPTVVCAPPPESIFPSGDTTVTCTATDTSANTSSSSFTVEVVDKTPPTITAVTATPSVLWPPNHKMVPVNVAVSADDICDAATSCRIFSVTSNEPVSGRGTGRTAPDWMITGDFTVNLRAESSGSGSGRIYTITVICTDDAGNASTETVTVTVPHDQRDKNNNNEKTMKKKK